MQVTFGAGTVVGKRTDVANTQVMFFGVTESWSVDMTQELVELVGQNKVAVDVAPAQLKVTGKIKFARIQSAMIGHGLLGVTPTTASGFFIQGPENKTNVGATTFTVTGGTSFTTDLGIMYHGTGIALTPTTATPAAGFYIPGVAGTGTYTIAAADQSVAGGLDVFYLQTSNTDIEIDLNSQLMGTGPTVELDMYAPYNVAGVLKRFGLRVYSARFSKMPFDLGNKKYLVPEVDYIAYANASGQIASFVTTE